MTILMTGGARISTDTVLAVGNRSSALRQFDPTPNTTLMDVARIQVELEDLLGITVDVLTPRALPDGFRERVLAEALPV